MSADDNIPMEAIDAAADAGAARCLNDSLEGISILRPPCPPTDVETELHYMRLDALGALDLQAYYVKLLSRAAMFVEFVRDNVGETADYPLRVSGDNLATVQEFQKQLASLEHITGLLMEI